MYIFLSFCYHPEWFSRKQSSPLSWKFVLFDEGEKVKRNTKVNVTRSWLNYRLWLILEADVQSCFRRYFSWKFWETSQENIGVEFLWIAFSEVTNIFYNCFKSKNTKNDFKDFKIRFQLKMWFSSKVSQ